MLIATIKPAAPNVHGAVACPAGLHFSDELLAALQLGIQLAADHAACGARDLPAVEREDLSALRFGEWVEVSADVIEAIRACTGTVIAVGTTSVRALEARLRAMEVNWGSFCGPVNLVIKPGYRFRVIQGLITNFHLPRSSLLLLVGALIGRQTLLKLYQEAIERNYRFFSYGDAMWIAPESVLTSAQASP